MEIRPLCPGDYASAQRLMAQVHALHAKNRPDVYRPAEVLPCEEYAALLDDPKRSTLAAEENGELLGFCVVRMRPITHDPALQKRAVAYMEDLCVDEAHRRAGVGRRLFAAAEALSREKGAQSLELMVWSFNESALRFYQAMGMSPRSIVMERRLD